MSASDVFSEIVVKAWPSFPLAFADVEWAERAAGWELRVSTTHGDKARRAQRLLPVEALHVNTYATFYAAILPLLRSAYDEVIGSCCDSWRLLGEPLGVRP